MQSQKKARKFKKKNCTIHFALNMCSFVFASRDKAHIKINNIAEMLLNYVVAEHRHTCDISLFRRDLPIFEHISLFGISKIPYITYTSPYFKFQISLFEIKNFLLCLIILPISKSKSPYLASQMYHMYDIGFIYNF